MMDFFYSYSQGNENHSGSLISYLRIIHSLSEFSKPIPSLCWSMSDGVLLQNSNATHLAP